MYRRGRMDRRRQQIPFATPGYNMGYFQLGRVPIVTAPHGSPYCSQLAARLDGAGVRLGSDPPHLHQIPHIDHSPHWIHRPPCGLGIKGDPPPSDLFFLQQLTHQHPSKAPKTPTPRFTKQPNSGTVQAIFPLSLVLQTLAHELHGSATSS